MKTTEVSFRPRSQNKGLGTKPGKKLDLFRGRDTVRKNDSNLKKPNTQIEKKKNERREERRCGVGTTREERRRGRETIWKFPYCKFDVIIVLST